MILRNEGEYISVREFPTSYFCSRRFKPVVRVKAKCVPSLDLLLKRSAAAVRAMTPDQREEMWRKQRESWVRGNTGWD
jgi:hypothetical protein